VNVKSVTRPTTMSRGRSTLIVAAHSSSLCGTVAFFQRFRVRRYCTHLLYHRPPTHAFFVWFGFVLFCFVLPSCPSVLKGYTTQHLPDSMSVMVESIVVKVSSSAEEPNTKVLLLSWSYQVSGERERSTNDGVYG